MVSMVFRPSRMMGLVLVGLSVSWPCVALPIPARSQMLAGRAEARGYSMLFVSAEAGSDTLGNGSQMRPFSTVTRALEQAAPNTVIVMAAGEYSRASGEVFPLRLKPGVTIQGSPVDRGQIVIRGGSSYLSPSRGLQNVTILASDGAGLGHVTVVNPHPAGQGLWIEAGSPVVRENVFAGNGSTGIFIAGPGSPIIQNNLFTDNGTAALVVGNASQARIVNNQFERNGIGIQVASGGAPRIENNRIVQNQDGLILQANAQPTLGANLIAQNRRNGLVEFQPVTEERVLSASPPSVVTFQAASAQSPVSAEAVAVPLRAASPEASSSGAPAENFSPTPESSESSAASPTGSPALETASESIDVAVRVGGPDEQPGQVVDALGNSDLAVDAAREEAPEEAVTTASQVTVESEQVASDLSTEPVALAEPREADELPKVSIEPRSSIPLASVPPVSADAGAEDVLVEAATPEPTPAETIADGDALDANSQRLMGLRQWLAERSLDVAAAEAEDETTVEAVELTVTPPPTEQLARAATPETSAPLRAAEPVADSPDQSALLSASSGAVRPLQVPEARIPIGSGGVQSIAGLPPSDGPPAPPSRAAALGLRYRVLVEAPNAESQRALRAIVTDAFRVRVDGRTMMQAGAYPDRETADAQVVALRSQGFEARIADIP